MKIKLIPIALSTLFLSACAPHLSQQQCAGMNWYQMGVNDGLNGQRRDLSSAIQDCSQFHITVDASAYQRGLMQGFHQYCTYDRGFTIGSQGAGNPNICPASLSRNFNQGYNAGLHQYCSYDRGFSLGVQGAGNPGICPSSIGKFNQGYTQGLRQFCTYNRGYALGSQGTPNPNTCPDNMNGNFNMGWQAGATQYCSPDRGYSMGTQGADYPGMCSPALFPAFSNAYNRGSAIHNRSSDLQSRIDMANNRINDLVYKYDYRMNSDGTYRLGHGHHNQTPKAQARLQEVNDLVQERDHLLKEQFKAQMN